MSDAPFYRLLSFAALVALATSCTRLPAPLTARRGAPTQPVVAITHVNVIPLTIAGQVVPNATVLIRNAQIVALTGPIPPGLR